MDKQPRQVCLAIAYRAAMRVLPLAGRRSPLLDDELVGELALASFRAALVAGVATVLRSAHSETVWRSAKSASKGARTARADLREVRVVSSIDAASRAAGAAADAASSADLGALKSSAVSATLAAAGADNVVLAATKTDMSAAPSRLMESWISKTEMLLEAHTQVSGEHGYLLYSGYPWSFWAIWYARAMAGDPLPWDLQEQVALIPDAVWDAGPEAVADRIAEIEGAYWATALPQAEEVVASDDGLFDVQPSVTADDDLMSRIFRQTEFALDLALNTNSGFSEMCVGFKLLRYTLDQCRTDPNTAEQNLRMARDIISRNVVAKSYDDHDALKVLIDSLNQHALELRGQHSEVRGAYEVRVQQTMREISDQARIEVAAAMREFQREKATGRLHEETGLDAETLETNSAVEAQASAVQRTGGRAAVARGLERASEAAKDVDASGGYKATRIGTTGYTIVEILWKVFGG